VSTSAEVFVYKANSKRRFKNAQVTLVKRLAEANWQRSIRMRNQARKGSHEEDQRMHDAATTFKPCQLPEKIRNVDLECLRYHEKARMGVLSIVGIVHKRYQSRIVSSGSKFYNGYKSRDKVG
jgi:hypothetical protein